MISFFIIQFMSESFKFLLDKLGENIKLIQKVVVQSKKKYCTEQRFNKGCKIQSYYQCKGASQQLFSIPNYTRNQQFCLSKGIQISGASGIDLPNNVYPQDASNDQKHLICDSLRLDQVFKKVKTQLTNEITHCYVGFSNGVYRIFPSFNRDCENAYDCRNRPWYTLATTGPKKVAIVIDVSSSMQPYKQQVKQATKKLIKTFGIHDYVSVLFQKSNTQFSFYQQMERGISTRIDQIQQMMENMVIGNEANLNFETAFEKINHLFSNVKDDTYGSPCTSATNIVIFITSNLPNQGTRTSAELANKIKTWNQNFHMKLFFYAMKQLPNFDLLKDLSNQFEGVAFDMSQQTKSLTHLLRFYETVLSSSINVDDMVCSEPYIDAFSGKKMITLSKSVYSHIETVNSKRNITEVIGIDIPMEYAQKYGMDETKIIKELMNCPKLLVNIDPCYLNYLRPQYSKKMNLSCPSYPNSVSCDQAANFTVVNSIHVPNQKQQFRGCEGLTYIQLAMLIVMPLLAIALFLGIKFIYRRYQLQENAVETNIRDMQNPENRPINPANLTEISQQAVSDNHHVA